MRYCLRAPECVETPLGWRVGLCHDGLSIPLCCYKHTGKDKDYEVYKEAINAATNEVRKSKRNFELKLAQNIKSDSNSFYRPLSRNRHCNPERVWRL